MTIFFINVVFIDLVKQKTLSKYIIIFSVYNNLKYEKIILTG